MSLPTGVYCARCGELCDALAALYRCLECREPFCASCLRGHFTASQSELSRKLEDKQDEILLLRLDKDNLTRDLAELQEKYQASVLGELRASKNHQSVMLERDALLEAVAASHAIAERDAANAALEEARRLLKRIDREGTECDSPKDLYREHISGCICFEIDAFLARPLPGSAETTAPAIPALPTVCSFCKQAPEAGKRLMHGEVASICGSCAGLANDYHGDGSAETMAPEPRHLPWPSDEELACAKGVKACSEGCPEFDTWKVAGPPETSGGAAAVTRPEPVVPDTCPNHPERRCIGAPTFGRCVYACAIDNDAAPATPEVRGLYPPEKGDVWRDEARSRTYVFDGATFVDSHRATIWGGPPGQYLLHKHEFTDGTLRFVRRARAETAPTVREEPAETLCFSRYDHQPSIADGEWHPLPKVCQLPRGHEGPHGETPREEPGK